MMNDKQIDELLELVGQIPNNVCDSNIVMYDTFKKKWWNSN